MLDRAESMQERTGKRAATDAPAMAVPMIPGLVSTQRHLIGRTNFHKGQVLERMAQGRLTEEPPGAASSSTRDTASPSAWLNVAAHHRHKLKTDQVQQAAATTSSTTTATAKPSQSTKYRTDTTQPKWITYDRQVLRFFGYFVEPIVQETHTATVQQDRIRRVVLFFYLSDHSLSISEPRVANSGLAQGEFMRRTIVKKPSSDALYEPYDFNVGGNVRLYGRTIHLVDCDDATRTFYDEALGHPQGSPCKYPDDQSSQVDEVDALKQRLKQKAAAAATSNAERVRKFHEHSQQVLRFFVSWQDPHPLYPETRRYVLHYYLSDDTIEIVEPRDEREGRGHFAVLLSRRRMVSDHAAKKDRPINDRDLRCGEYVHVYARRFFLEDCDAFTRDYYLETHGVTQEKVEPEERTRREKAAKWKLFQVDPTEVLACVEGTDRLKLKGERTGDATNNQRFYQNDALENKQLRFRARFHGLHTRSDANAQREFVVTFFLEDDTLSVFEPRVKNSGVAGGRFLDRGRFRKCVDHADGGTLSREKDKAQSTYRASDFYVGAVVGFEFAPQQKLELIEADRQTLTFCESHPEMFPYSDIAAVMKSVGRVVESTSKRLTSAAIRRAFRVVDTARNGTLPVGDVKRVLERLGITNDLNAQQLVTLCRKFEDDQSDEQIVRPQGGPLPFLYDDFCDAVALGLESQAASDVLEKLRKCTDLRRRLRGADSKRQSVVDAAEVTQVAAAYKIVLTNSEVLAISSRFPGNHRQRRGVIDYNALCDRVFDGQGEEKTTAHRDREHHHEVRTRVDRAPGRGHVEQRTLDEEDEDDTDWEQRNQYSLGRRPQDDAQSDDALDGFGDDGSGDACLPMDSTRGPLASPRRQTQPSRVPLLPKPFEVRSQTGALPAPRKEVNIRGQNPPSTDARVVALLRRVFGDRKYLLRKMLRDRDHDKSGFLGEEAFMDAVLAVEPRLSDDDTYLIADVYFPTNNSQIDYTKLLESAFRS